KILTLLGRADPPQLAPEVLAGADEDGVAVKVQGAITGAGGRHEQLGSDRVMALPRQGRQRPLRFPVRLEESRRREFLAHLRKIRVDAEISQIGQVSARLESV